MSILANNTSQLRKQIKTTTIKEDFVDSYKLFLEDSFENSPNYYEINTNMDYATNYKCLIMDYDTNRNLIGYKKIIQYPYDTQIFKVGDYINWVYDGIITDWLVFAMDKQFDYNVQGKIKKCNNSLKWLDNYNNLNSYPCVIDDKINNSDLDISKNIIVPQGGILVYIQKNSITDDIAINQRFIFNNQAFKVNALINYSSPYFITIIMQKDMEAIDDDLINSIANANSYQYVLTINQSSFTQVVGYTSTLTADLVFNNEEINSPNLIWTSSNVAKATINSSTGVVSLLSSGSCNRIFLYIN